MPDSSLKMDCLLGCFGISSKRKRRKQASRVLPGAFPPSRVSLTHPSTNLHISEELVLVSNPDHQKGDEIKDPKIEKRVRFNLEVKAYDPVKENEFENEKKLEEEVSEESKPLFPSNHRYGNCDDSYYEDECESDPDYELEDEFEEIDEIDEDDSKGEVEDEEVLGGHSVLKPIENVAQWKAAIKGKEFESKKISDEVSVAASLSSWLVN